MPSPTNDDWLRLGFDGDPVPGDPQVLQGIVDDFTYLRDTAWSVSQGLDAFVASASGGFAGATADALREVVSGRLKTFVFNIARAFSLAGEAVAEYKLALVQAQQVAADALRQAAGLAVGDAKLAGLKRQVAGQVDQVGAAARAMEAALRDAADMVSQPIKVPSLWDRIKKKVELALSIVGGVLALLSSVVDGPIGIALGTAAFAAGAAALGMTAADVARHQAGWAELLLAGLGLLAPWGRGMFSMAELGAGARAVAEGATAAWEAVRSPALLAGWVARGVPAAVRGVAGLAAAAGRGLMWLPSAVWRGVGALPSVLRGTPGSLRGIWQGASGAVAQDFAGMLERYPRLAQAAQALGFAGRVGMYGGVNFARVAGALLTPLRFSDIAALGFRGAWAPLREAADWGKGLADFRAGWAGYPRLGAVGKGLTAAGLHELSDLSWHGGNAGLHEPEVAPAAAGMQWHRMLTTLEKMPQAEFQQLFVKASGILQPVIALMPIVGRDAMAQALRAEGFAPVVAVAYTLRTQGEDAAKTLAADLAKELGATPLHGLAGGAPIRRLPGGSSGQALESGLRLPESAWTRRTSGVRKLEEQGAQAGDGERSPLVLVLPGELPLLQQKLNQDAALGLMNTNRGLAVPIDAVFTPEAVQALERISEEGLPPEVEKQLHLGQMPEHDGALEPVTVTEHAGPTAFPHEGARSRALRGVPELAGAQVQLVHDVRQEPRLELVDVHGVPLPGRVVTPHALGDGFQVAGGSEGVLHFSAEGKFQFRTVPLPGSQWQLRFKTAAGVDGHVRLVFPDGAPIVVDGHRVEFAREAPGELAVRIAVVDATGVERAQSWRLSSTGMVREVPLTGAGENIGALSGLSLREYLTSDGQVVQQTLIGDFGRMLLFEDVPVSSKLADQLGAGAFALREKATGTIFSFDAAGQTVVRQQAEAEIALLDETAPTVEEYIATDPYETLKLLRSGTRTDPATSGRGAEAEEAHAPRSVPGSVPAQKSSVRPEQIAIGLARVFTSNFVADSGSLMLYQELSGQSVTFWADLRTGAFDALGTTVFAVGGRTLAKGAGFKGPIGQVLKSDGASGTLVNGMVGNVVGGLVADWSNKQNPPGLWQDAVTNAASGVAGNAGSYAIAEAVKERKKLSRKAISNRDKVVDVAIEDPLSTLMYTAAYTAGDVTEADVQQLASGG
ncbi:MAG: hypothetical protein JO362_18005 [Streptomycetaceae bacterium]|nr:hypothetical protein [Streptomycetaceae bacterium]